MRHEGNLNREKHSLLETISITIRIRKIVLQISSLHIFLTYLSGKLKLAFLSTFLYVVRLFVDCLRYILKVKLIDTPSPMLLK